MDYSEYFSKIEQTFQKCRKSSTPLPPLDWGLVESWFNRGVPLHIILEVIEENFAQIEQGRRRKISSLRYFQDEVKRRFEKYVRLNSNQSSNSKESSNAEASDFSFVLSSLKGKIAQLEEVLKACQNERLREKLENIHLRLIMLKREVELGLEVKLNSELRSRLEVELKSEVELESEVALRSEVELKSGSEAELESAVELRKEKFLNESLKFIAEEGKVNEKIVETRSNLISQSRDVLDYVEYELEKLDSEIAEFLPKVADAELMKICKERVEKEMAKYEGRMSREAYRRTYSLLVVKILRDEYNLPKLSLFEL